MEIKHPPFKRAPRLAIRSNGKQIAAITSFGRQNAIRSVAHRLVWGIRSDTIGPLWLFGFLFFVVAVGEWAKIKPRWTLL